MYVEPDFDLYLDEPQNAWELPAHVFFTPNDYFWKLLLATQGVVNLIECGSGMGLILEHARQKDFPLRGVDIAFRRGQSKLIESKDATLLSWDPFLWPLLCRPSHGRWLTSLLAHAANAAASVLYVGLKKNLSRDLYGYSYCRISKKPVGIEGEHLYLVRVKASVSYARVLSKLLLASEDAEVAAA